MALATLVASCASWRAVVPERTAAPAAVDTAESRSPHAVVRYVVSAPEGARTRLDDPLVGGPVDVEVGRAYVSATASQCKRFNTVAAGGERTVRTWAVCRVDGRDWELVTAGAAPLGQQ
ncbi:DVU3141 family protein [Novispirillum sp. DQ9]|uniref:DVU3141 family protein n=1 Tax=Novispirillum sp. DQ9 TaxID=3398612 RepID=UPI003C7DB865